MLVSKLIHVCKRGPCNQQGDGIACSFKQNNGAFCLPVDDKWLYRKAITLGLSIIDSNEYIM